MEGTIIMNLSLGTNVALVTLFHISSHAPGRGGTSCSNTLRRHIACLASVSVRFRNESQRPCKDWLSFHFSRGQNRKSRSSVFLSSKTKQKGLLRRLATHGFVCTGKFLWKSLSLQQNFVAATSRTNSIWFDYLRHVAVTKFCCGDKDFVGRDEIRALLKTPAWEATSFLFP